MCLATFHCNTPLIDKTATALACQHDHLRHKKTTRSKEFTKETQEVLSAHSSLFQAHAEESANFLIPGLELNTKAELTASR